MRIIQLILLATLSLPLTATEHAKLFVGRGATVGTYVTELRIGRTVYTSKDYCAAAGLSGEYPAKLEKDKITLMVGAKVCRYRVTDSHPYLLRGK